MAAKPIDLDGVKIERIPISQLHESQRNSREHGGRGDDVIGASIETFGMARSIVLDGDNVTPAGNGTLAQAKARGIKQAIVVETDGSVLVAVRRPDWTQQQAELYGITDNRSTDLSKNDYAVLSEQFREALDAGVADMDKLEELGWHDWELDPVLGGTWEPPAKTNDHDHLGPGYAPPILVTPEQRGVFERAMEALRTRLAELNENEDFSEGQAVELICAEFLGAM